MICFAVCLLFFSLVAASPSLSGNKVLTIIDNPEQSLYSVFLNDLKERGFSLTTKSASDKVNLLTFGELSYDHLIILSSTTAVPGDLSVKGLVEFVNKGGNVILAGSSNIPEVLRDFSLEFSADFDDQKTLVLDDFNQVQVGNTKAIYSSNFGSKANPILTNGGSLNSQVTIDPVLFSGVAHRITGKNGLIIPVLSGSPSSYSFDNSKSKSVVNPQSPFVGSKLSLVSALQARNNARVLFSGSSLLFSNEFFEAQINGKKSGNKEFATQVAKWTLQEKRVLQFKNERHHREGQKDQLGIYRIEDDMVFEVSVSEFYNGKWHQFNAKDIQFEAVMLDPYVRKTMVPSKTVQDPSSTRYLAFFKLPDQYGVFTFKVSYMRHGFSWSKVSDTVEVRPFRHNEYPRFLVVAYPYYANAFSMIFGFVLLLLFLLLVSASVLFYSNQDYFFSKSAFRTAGLVFAIILHEAEFQKSKMPSGVLLFFWLFSFLVSFLEIRSLLLRDVYHSNPLHFWLHLVDLLLVIGIFLLELVPKKVFYSSLNDDVNVSPEENAHIFSRLSFSWMSELMKLGYEKDLELQDLWNLRKIDSAAFNSDRFQTLWRYEVLKDNPSFLRTMLKAFGPMFSTAAIFKLCQDFLAFTQPQLLKQIMAFAGSWSTNDPLHPPEPLFKGAVLALMMLLTAICQTFCLHQYFHICLLTGMRIRAALVTAIYRKALYLSSKSRQKSTVGEIVNLMSVDASKLMDLCSYLHIAWSGPLQICLALYFLYQTLGPAIFAGVAVMIMMVPINGFIAAKSKQFNKRQMKNKDSRSRLMDEFLNGIKVIKLYAWEFPFLKKINSVRDAELGMLKKIAYLSAFQTFTWSCTPFFVSFSSFALYSFISQEPLTSQKVFVALSLFNLLQFPLAVFPNVISSIIEATVSFNRLYEFLTSEELDIDAVVYEPVTPTSDKPIERVVVQDASFSWDRNRHSILKSISFTASDSNLLSIVGSVGCGKSSIISAILGEMYKTKGQVIVRGSIAFVPQTPWIMNATLRDNILFGNRYDSKFYKQTLKACGLEPDLEMLAAGDLTEIGERGINLSGGQKQRISIARAVYSRADIYLFDDSLSAVDSHVGMHIFKNVIGPKGMLSTKARIFVTHGIQYLHKCNEIIYMEHGKIVEKGKYNEIMQKKGLVFDLLNEYGKKKNESSDKLAEPELLNQSKSTTPAHSRNSSGKKNVLIEKETSAKGSVSWSVYKTYADSCSWSNVAAYLAIAILGQALSVSQNLYLAQWAGENDRETTLDQSTIIHKLTVYGALGMSYALTVILQVIFVWVFCGIKSAKMLHSNLLNSIVRLPMSFFDTTPLGRIMNRFSKDVYTVDEVLPRSFQGYFRTLFAVLSVLAVNSLSSPLFLVFAFPLSILYIYFQKFYLSTSRELKRLESTTRSPIYAHFQETLGGVSSIRAYKQEFKFISTNEDRVDDNQKAYYPNISSNRWLAVRLEFIGALLVFASAIFAVVSILITGHVSASLVGLAITYSLTVTQTLNWMVRMSCEIESQIISVERIKEYIELEHEAPYQDDSTLQISSEWPEKGLIEFQEYSTRYRQGLDFVLDSISFTAKPGEKIGLVGRTGSGKCLAKGEKVLMYDGSIRLVEDIKVGDLVMGDDSTPRTVLETHSGSDALYKITNLKGKSYKVNSNHILSLIYTGKKHIRARPEKESYQVNWFNKDELKMNSKTFSYKNKDEKEARREAQVFLDALKDDRKVDISVKDYLQLSKHDRENLKGYQVPIDFSETPLPIDPYMIGYWLGDGTADRPDICSQDNIVLDYFRENVPDYNLFLDPVKEYTYKISSGYGQKGNVFLQTLKNLNLINNKHIPKIYKCNSRKNRLELLAGFLDADGHKPRDNNIFEVVQAEYHEKLLDDIIYLANSLGFSAAKRNKKTSWTHKGIKKKGTSFRIFITGEGIETIPTKIPRKQARPRKNRVDALISRIKVEEVGQGEYYGIELDGNHRYVLGNFIVTHNSTLTLAMFRILEAAHGSVKIDDIDIKLLGLKDLRSRLTIIPQDPVLFSGTLRENLDPFGVKNDAELWNAIECASLKPFISSQESGLDCQVLQGGENFSVGQRQLICLARAILRRTNILILDEATAAIDVETDKIIQKTIRIEFKHCTILTIAHRINTVLDYDRILVLEKGKVIEFDSPQKLLSTSKSKFYSLAKEAGLV